MRIPPWPLRREPLPESERLRQLGIDAEATPGPPASVWREAYLALLARLEQSKDPRIRRLGDIAFEEAHSLVYRRGIDQQKIYDEILDGMRRLDVPRVRPGAFDVWYAFLRCQQVRRKLEKEPAKTGTVAQRAIAQVAAELNTTPHVLQARFSKWELDPRSDDMITIPNRDPRPAAFFDFEVPLRARRRGRRQT